MRLVNLRVINTISGESIRNIDFNPKGLSLIVDETNKVGSGSNIGKTTAVKIIDLCLGAKSASSIYKEKDTGENVIVGNYIEENKVVAELTCTIDGETHVFSRALYKNGKNKINGEQVPNITAYRDDLNSLIFNNRTGKPTLRELISKFIRLEDTNETALLKFLGGYTTNFQYQAIYEYLFGIDESKSKNVNIVALNEGIQKDIEAIFRKNSVSSLKEFETKISLMEEEVEKFKKAYSEVTVVADYDSKVEENHLLLAEIERHESELSKFELKKMLMEDSIKKEEEKIFLVDSKLLRRLYEETKLNLNEKLRDFEDLEKFHNGMVHKRIDMLRAALEDVINKAKDISDRLRELRTTYESNYVSLNVAIKDKFEEKYTEYTNNKIKLENFINDHNYVLKKIEEKENNLSKKVALSDDKSKRENIEETINYYFKEFTQKIIGETFAIVLNENESENEFPVKIIGMNGKPGTGIKKAMITCFDLAHINLIIKMNFHMPIFAIHDRMENIDLSELSGIINETRSFEGQYIFPILSDRIDTLGIKEDEIILRLSATNKFFGI